MTKTRNPRIRVENCGTWTRDEIRRVRKSEGLSATYKKMELI